MDNEADEHRGTPRAGSLLFLKTGWELGVYTQRREGSGENLEPLTGTKGLQETWRVTLKKGVEGQDKGEWLPIERGQD